MIKHISRVTRNTGLITLSLLISIMALYPATTSAEETEVGYGYTKTIDESVFQMAVDSSGNSYQAGAFGGTTDFDTGAGSDNHTSAGSNDIFLTKLNADGTYEYTKTMGGTGSDYAINVAVDEDDNIYLAGTFAGTVDFDPGAGTDNHTAAGFGDVFLTKLNADGTYGYTKTIGGATGDPYQYSIATDQQGSVYLSGAFGGTIDFDPGAGVDEITPLDELYDVYLTKINADGTYGYTKTIHGPVDEASHPIATDQNNNVYMAGYFYDATVDFDPGAGTDEHTANGAYAFLTKLSSDGSYEYTKTFGGDGDGTVIAESIKTDQGNNVYLTGTLNDTADFDPGVGTDNHSSAHPISVDTFLTKINADGTYDYTKTIGAESNDVEAGFVDIDQENNVYLAGKFRYSSEGGNSTVDFDPGLGTDDQVSSASLDTFLTRINADGSYAYTKTIGGTSSDFIYSLAVDQLSNVYLSGRFDGTVDFDPTSGTDNKTATGDGGFAFLTKLTQTTYQQITNLDPSLAAKTLSNTDATDNNIEQDDTITIRLLLSDTTPIADVTTTFTTDLDWSTVTAESDPDAGTAFVHNLTAADGTAGTYTLYVPKLAGDTRVGICPGASSLTAVTDTCEGLYYLTEGVDNNLTTTTIDGQDYWAITGLTGTGGFSAAAATTTTTDTDSEALAATGENQITMVVMTSLLFAAALYVTHRLRKA